MNTISASLLIGGCIALLLWQILIVFTRVPTDERLYRDVPAAGFRIVWPLIRLLVFYTGRFMPASSLEEIQLKLLRAGAEYSLNDKEVMASRFIAAGLFAAAASVLVLIYGVSVIPVIFIAGFLGYHYPDAWLKQTARSRQSAMLKVLPFYLDVITLSVESGSNLTGGMTQAVQKTSDSPLRREFSRVLRDIRSGKSRADALREFSRRADSQPVNQVVSGLIQGEKAGANLGPLLRAQSEQLRTQRFQLAEKKAMQAPVKLLGPLFICIFPMTFIVLIFVVLSKMIAGGLITSPLLLWAYGWPGV
ncbi:type II secretion system F family protein [Granulosicoccus sp.]|nr:type II secretion system F family protein [Granulosicoccus sp.]